jgi:CRP-like cAMP-binding protein
MGRIDLLNHFANVLYVIAYFFRDILWLRVMVIAGCSLEIFYRFHVASSPLWADIIWCSIFIVLNSYQLIDLIRERRTLQLTPEEMDLHRNVFSVLPKMDFKKLVNAGKRTLVPAEAVIIEEKQHIDCLFLLVKGRAEVVAGGNVVSYLADGSFAGEISFLTGNPTSAKVITTMPAHCIVWEKKTLIRLLEENEQLRRGMDSVFNKDLINKVLKHTESNAGQPMNPAHAPN